MATILVNFRSHIYFNLSPLYQDFVENMDLVF